MIRKPTRDGTIYVEPQVLWSLGHIVKAHNLKLTEMDTPLCIDGLANDILLEWITKTKPALNDLWLRREAINEEALQL